MSWHVSDMLDTDTMITDELVSAVVKRLYENRKPSSCGKTIRWVCPCWENSLANVVIANCSYFLEAHPDCNWTNREFCMLVDGATGNINTLCFRVLTEIREIEACTIEACALTRSTIVTDELVAKFVTALYLRRERVAKLKETWVTADGATKTDVVLFFCSCVLDMYPNYDWVDSDIQNSVIGICSNVEILIPRILNEVRKGRL